MSWHAVNAYTLDHQDDLILEVVKDWTDRLAADHRLHFVRHWQGGPHVSVRIEATVERFRERLADTLTSEAAQWLRQRDAEAQHVEPSMLQDLAARERHDTVLEPQPPGTVDPVEDIPRRVEALGGPAAATLYEDYLCASHRHALDGVALAAEHGRLRLAFDALVTAPDGLLGDISRFFLSYRSHADGFLMNTPDPEATRAFFERSYQKHADALRARVHGLLEGADDRLAQWGRAASPRLRAFMRHASEGLASGALEPVGSEEPADLDDPRLRHSSFHRTAHNTGVGQAIERSAAWQAYRLAINYLYADLARVGVTGVERFLLCHLVSRAVEDALGLDATEQLARLDGHTPE